MGQRFSGLFDYLFLRLSKAFPSHDRQGVECANFYNLVLAWPPAARVSSLAIRARIAATFATGHFKSFLVTQTSVGSVGGSSDEILDSRHRIGDCPMERTLHNAFLSNSTQCKDRRTVCGNINENRKHRFRPIQVTLPSLVKPIIELMKLMK